MHCLLATRSADPTRQAHTSIRARRRGDINRVGVLWWSTVIGLILQLLSARLGVVTGLNLAQMARRKYGPRLATPVLRACTHTHTPSHAGATLAGAAAAPLQRSSHIG